MDGKDLLFDTFTLYAFTGKKALVQYVMMKVYP